MCDVEPIHSIIALTAPRLTGLAQRRCCSCCSADFRRVVHFEDRAGRSRSPLSLRVEERRVHRQRGVWRQVGFRGEALAEIGGGRVVEVLAAADAAARTRSAAGRGKLVLAKCTRSNKTTVPKGLSGSACPSIIGNHEETPATHNSSRLLVPDRKRCAIAPAPKQNVAAGRHPNIAAAQRLSAQAYQKIVAAQQANEWDMQGHAQKAKDLLDQANNELKAAAQAANKAK